MPLESQLDALKASDAGHSGSDDESDDEDDSATAGAEVDTGVRLLWPT
jgi:hypothetical protein